MKIENTNDFSKCKIDDKLWSMQLGDCKVVSVSNSQNSAYPIGVIGKNRCCIYTKDGKFNVYDVHQSLFFSNPNIVAPPEPLRLPDYKPGQWIAVWDEWMPAIRKFIYFNNDNEVVCKAPNECYWEINWPNYCSLEELPEVLAKWGEKK